MNKLSVTAFALFLALLAAAPLHGFFLVTSTPSGASIIFNGTYTGFTTPHDFDYNLGCWSVELAGWAFSPGEICFDMTHPPPSSLHFTGTSLFPAAPSGISATALSAREISLGWTDNSSNESGFRIEWLIGASTEWSQIADLSANSTAHLRTALIPGTAYQFRVCAYNQYGDSEFSNTAGATTPNAPPAPSNLSATVNESIVHLAWQAPIAPPPTHIGYKIYLAGALFQTILDPAITTFDDSHFVGGPSPAVGTFGYAVSALYTDGESDPTAPVCITLSPFIAPPADVSVVPGGDHIILYWTGTGDYANIYRSYTPYGDYTYFGSTAAGDYGLAPQPWDDYQFHQVSVIETEDLFIYVPGGTFTMGDTNGIGDVTNRPVHSVTLSSFYICKYEVTQAEYTAVMDVNPASEHGEGADYPVYSVSWYSAIKYCNLRSMWEGYTPVYTINGSTDPAAWGPVPTDANAAWNAVTMNLAADGYRLPTEAEWEYAARGATTIPDYVYAGGILPDNYAWYGLHNPTIGFCHPVGQLAPNGIGAYDMSGNVNEWVWDWFAYYRANAQTNPTGFVIGETRVLRGGYHESSLEGIIITERLTMNPEHGFIDMGFRVCRSALE